MPTMTIAKPLLPFLEKPKRFKVAIGGRGSTKSMTIADLCLMDAQTKGIKTACFREYQNTIDDSVLALLKSEVDRLRLVGFQCQKKSINYNGEEMFVFRGLARNPEGVKSMHGFNRAWVEEAQTISADSLRALSPTIREEGSEIWMSANLRSMADPFSQRFFKPFEKELRKHRYYEDKDHLIVWINYTDSPFFPMVLEQERRFHEETMSKAEYNHVWLGECYDEVLGSIIPIEWFDSAIDAHEKLGFKPEGATFASFDPSDQGADSKGFALRHGSVYKDICDKEEGDINDGLDWAVEKALRGGADFFIWDIGGMGTGLKREVDRLLKDTHTDYVLFNGAERPDHRERIYQPVDSDDPEKRRKIKEVFVNRRAQYYYRLADRFERTYRAVRRAEKGLGALRVEPAELISLSSNIKQLDELRSEVCRIPRKPNNNGMKQIMTKIEMRKKPFELPSPNMADAMMMAEYIPDVKQKAKKLRVVGWG